MTDLYPFRSDTNGIDELAKQALNTSSLELNSLMIRFCKPYAVNTVILINKRPQHCKYASQGNRSRIQSTH